MKTEKEMNDTEETRATYQVMNKDGYSILLTIPANATSEELQNMFINLDAVDSLLAVNEFKPQIKSSFQAKLPFVPKEKNWTGEKCTLDGGRLYKETTKTGKTFTACENRKFDFLTKQTTGCPFVSWEKSY